MTWTEYAAECARIGAVRNRNEKETAEFDERQTPPSGQTLVTRTAAPEFIRLQKEFDSLVKARAHLDA